MYNGDGAHSTTPSNQEYCADIDGIPQDDLGVLVQQQ